MLYSMNGCHWRETDYGILLSWVRAGLPIDEIAQMLKRSPSAIRSKLTRLGLNYDGTVRYLKQVPAT